ATAFLLCVLLCGKGINGALTPQIVGLDSVATSFIYGAFAVFISFVVTDFFKVGYLCLVPPALVAVWQIYKSRTKKTALVWVGDYNILLIVCAAFLALYTLCILLPSGRADKLGNFFYHQDMLWSVGNAAAVHNGFPLVDMRFSASTLNYHYLNDALAGILGLGTGNPAYESLCFYFYPLVGITLIFSLYAVAKKVCANTFLACLFPVMVLWVNGGASESVYHYLSNINGQGSATLALCAGLILICSLPRDKKDYFKYLIASVVFGFTISMFKSTIGALFILAVGAACLVGLWGKKTRPSHFIALLGLSVGFGIAYFGIFSSAVNNLVFNGLGLLTQLPKTLWSYCPLGVILYCGALVFSLISFKKLSFLQLVANAMFVGGAIAYSTYYHYSASQIYFLLIAIPMMWLALLGFVDKKICVNKNAMAVFGAVLILGCIPSGLRLLPNARSGVQAWLRVYNLRQSDYNESYITKDDYDAMVWLRDNTEQTAIFATNRNNKVFQAAEGTFHYYSAVSQRRAYLES
ncbi:MAG: hypothetical protein RSA20_07600, partial [Oscillospiraceae bacterium]